MEKDTITVSLILTVSFICTEIAPGIYYLFSNLMKFPVTVFRATLPLLMYMCVHLCTHIYKDVGSYTFIHMKYRPRADTEIKFQLGSSIIEFAMVKNSDGDNPCRSPH